jgi:hypothetical protein
MKSVSSYLRGFSSRIRQFGWFDRRRTRRSPLGFCGQEAVHFARGRHRFEIHSAAKDYVGYRDGKPLFRARQRHVVARKLLRYPP